MTDRAEALLAGPRGRQLCLQLVLGPAAPRWPELIWTTEPAGHPVARYDRDDARRSLAAAVAAADLAALAGTADPAAFVPALLAAVDSARYWQEPADDDALLGDADLAAQLRPVAEAVAGAPAARWWAEPLATATQHTVLFEPADNAPQLTGTRPALARWRAETLAAEHRAAQDRPADPHANWSGEWWSTPVLAGLVVTIGVLPGRTAAPRPAATRLLLVEDELSWETAATWPVPVPDWARVLEITGPQDWVDLVRRHPLDVTASRRHDWWRATGAVGPLLIPDWSAVAGEFEAVHLTVDGYLSTAGRALPVDRAGAPGWTVLAGWDPDATWWLTDLFELGEQVNWRRRDDEPPRWTPA